MLQKRLLGALRVVFSGRGAQPGWLGECLGQMPGAGQGMATVPFRAMLQTGLKRPVPACALSGTLLVMVTVPHSPHHKP